MQDEIGFLVTLHPVSKPTFVRQGVKTSMGITFGDINTGKITNNIRAWLRKKKYSFI